MTDPMALAVLPDTFPTPSLSHDSSSAPRFASPSQQLQEQAASSDLSVHHTSGKNKDWTNSSQLTSGEVNSHTGRVGNCSRRSKANNLCCGDQEQHIRIGTLHICSKGKPLFHGQSQARLFKNVCHFRTF